MQDRRAARPDIFDRPAQRQIETELHTKLEVARTQYESTSERYAFEKYWRALDNFNRFILYEWANRVQSDGQNVKVFQTSKSGYR
jgi:hypothetical protein